MGTQGSGALATRVASSESDEVALSPTILVVEDDADTRAAMTLLLEEAGYRVISLADGERAFEYLADNPPPACIVLDLWMPNMDGWSLASAMQLGQVPAAPILVVTAAGAHYGYPVPPGLVLRKPVDPARLLRMVRTLAPHR
jgi:CheY-like chemotaxis protein